MAQIEEQEPAHILTASFVDSHCHLDYKPLCDDIEFTLQRAQAAGIGAALTIATSLGGFAGVAALAERRENLWCTVGVHPHEAGREPVIARELRQRSTHPKVVGLGETGLDYHYDNSPRPAQQAAFRTHIEAAAETGLPVIVHTREAEADTAAFLEEAAAAGVGGVLHCFSSSRQLADLAIEFGFYISISGIVTFKNAEDLRAVVRALPLERLLLETDAPYLAPVPHRGRPNEPALLVHTARLVAALQDVEPAALARATSDNFFRLFTKANRPAGFL
jgi:TatD DNase family protein